MPPRKKEPTDKAEAAKKAAPATKPADNTAAPEKSAYQLAVEAGYTGTEEQFNDPEFAGTPIVGVQGDTNVPAAPAKPDEEPGKPKQEQPTAKPEPKIQLNLKSVFEALIKLGFKGTQADLKSFVDSFEGEKAKADGKYTVAKPFKDAARHLGPGENAKKYEVGEDVSYFDAQRLQSMLEKGLVTKE